LGSTCELKSTNASWNALMEAQFLLDLARDTSASTTYPPTTECSSFLSESAALPCPDQTEQLAQSPRWSLTVLAEDDPCFGDTRTLQTPANIGERISKGVRKNRKKLKRKWKLSNRLPLESFYQSSEDWGDLYLVRKMLGGKGLSSESEATSEKSDEIDSEEDYSSLGYSLESVEGKMAKDMLDLDNSTKARGRRRPVEEMIRKKVLESRERLVAGSKSSNSVTEEGEPDTLQIKESLGIVMENEAMEIISPEYVDDIEMESLDKTENEASSIQFYKQRTTRWYEKQPFEDPILEAKRLRSLRAKINHDKRRFDVEILKVEAQELKYENLHLREELLKFEEREAELMLKLKDKETAEARVKDLEREVDLRRQNEKVLKMKLQQISKETKAVVLVQVCCKLQ